MTLIPPAIILATRALGMRDREVAEICGIGPQAVAEWVAAGRVPPLKHCALLLAVVRVVAELLVHRWPDTDVARHTEIACDAAKAYVRLAEVTLTRDLGGAIPQELIDRARAEARRMIDRWPPPRTREPRPSAVRQRRPQRGAAQ